MEGLGRIKCTLIQTENFAKLAHPVAEQFIRTIDKTEPCTNLDLISARSQNYLRQGMFHWIGLLACVTGVAAKVRRLASK